MRTIICAVMLVLSSTAAFVSGGIWCSADDAAVKFQLDAGVTNDLGNPTFNFRGNLEILGGPVGDDLRKTMFENSNLTQYWLDDRELRLLVYHEHGVSKMFSSVELTILTKAKEEGVYDGQYTLAVYDSTADTDHKSVEFKGKVSCGAE